MAMLRSLLLLFIVFSMGNAEALWRRIAGNLKNAPMDGQILESDATSSSLRRSPGSQQRDCQLLDANLASVHSKIEHDFLLSLLPPSTTRCWFGSHDGEQEGRWLWTDGTPFDFTYWEPGQPDSKGTKNCGEFNLDHNRWNDAACLTSLGYVFAKYL